MADRLTAATAMMILSLLVVNAVWGLTSNEETLLSSALSRVMPLGYWIALGLLAIVAVAVFGVISRVVALQAFAFMLLGYLLGVVISRYAYQAIEPRGGIPLRSYSDMLLALWERNFLLWPAAPMLVVYLVFLKGFDSSPLRFGSWRVQPRDVERGEKGISWVAQMGLFMGFVVFPLAVFMQSTVGFAPVTSGTMFVFMIPVAVLALFNAFTEELLFRGFIQSSFTIYLGSTAGIVAQGVFFAFHHWGASPNLIAGLPTAIILCGLGIYWGHSVRATGGLGWAICAHALVDMTYFSAHFVRSD